MSFREKTAMIASLQPSVLKSKQAKNRTRPLRIKRSRRVHFIDVEHPNIVKSSIFIHFLEFFVNTCRSLC